MLTMEQAYYIRYEYNNKGKSIRQISRETGHAFDTVKKYIAMEDFSPKPPVKRTRKGKTTKYRETVKKWLIDDEQAPRKQRHTAHRVFTRLKKEAQAEGREFDVSERSIRNLVAKLREEISSGQEVSIPLSHPAGEAQVDFGDTVFYENGIMYEGHHLAVTFPHSDGKFVQLFKGENLECLSQGLKNIFEHIGKVPTVIRFDNMSTAVKKILSYGEREVTEGFKRLMNHYNFQSNFCNPESGHEKGSVENYVGTSRRNLFVPVPRTDDLEKYNKELLEECSKEMQERVHYKHERIVSDLFQEDLEAMNDLPNYDFDACKFVFCKTNKYGYAKYDTNSYSTSSQFACKTVTLKVAAMNVTVLNDNSEVIVTHPRLYGKNKESTLWGPYLSLIAKRPMALKYTGFFERLPAKTKEYFSGCSIPERKKALHFLSQESKRTGYEKALSIFNKAVSMGAKDPDSLIAGYRFLTEPKLPEVKMRQQPYFPKTTEYKVDLDAYMSLISEAHHV